MCLARTAFSRKAPTATAFALAVLLAAAGSVSARPPLFSRLFSPQPYDPAAYLQNSAVLPSYYWSVSKFDRANAGAFGPYTPQAWTDACPVDAAPAAPADARIVVDPPPAPPRQP